MNSQIRRLTLDLKRVDPSSFSSKMLSAAASSDIIGPFLRKTSIKIRVNTPNDLCFFVLIDIKFWHCSFCKKLRVVWDISNDENDDDFVSAEAFCCALTYLNEALKSYFEWFDALLYHFNWLQSIKVLRNPLYHFKTLQNVHNIVNAPPFDAILRTQLSRFTSVSWVLAPN